MMIVPYRRDYAPVFDRLNRAWIEQYFTVEPFDNEVLTKPEEYILKDGGEIWFVEVDGEPLGCCALLKLEDGMFEFTKLGVDEKARGKGLARALLRHCAARSKELGAHTLRIFTSSKLVPANTLYRSEGFIEKEMTLEQRARYKRGDIMYDLKL